MTWLALIAGLACVPIFDPVTSQWLRERRAARRAVPARSYRIEKRGGVYVLLRNESERAWAHEFIACDGCLWAKIGASTTLVLDASRSLESLFAPGSGFYRPSRS